MRNKLTIYDIAKDLGIAPSSVSKALNNLPNISQRVRDLVQAKAKELGYVHNSNAANLRGGYTKTIGVIVPKLNTAFFSNIVSAIEKECSLHNHHVIVCQTDEKLEKEINAIELLISKQVDCILISLTQETTDVAHLQRVVDLKIPLIQFDRVNELVDSHIVVSDNKEAAYKSVMHLIQQGYKQIALLGGPDHLSNYRERKSGYLQALSDSEIDIPYRFVVDDVNNSDAAKHAALKLLKGKNPPDAFFAVSDYAALAAIQAAQSLSLQVPAQIGIMGFANENFSAIIAPSLSSVDQNCTTLGRQAISIYFDKIRDNKTLSDFERVVIQSSIINRESSHKGP